MFKLDFNKPRTTIPKSFFIIESYLNILGFCRIKLEPNAKIKNLRMYFLVEFNYYAYKHSLTERWLSG